MGYGGILTKESMDPSSEQHSTSFNSSPNTVQHLPHWNSLFFSLSLSPIWFPTGMLLRFMYVTATANLVHKPRTQKRRSQTTTENYTRARKTITRRIGLFFIGRASTTSPNCLVFNPLYESWKLTFKRMLIPFVVINSASKTLARRRYPRCI